MINRRIYDDKEYGRGWCKKKENYERGQHKK